MCLGLCLHCRTIFRVFQRAQGECGIIASHVGSARLLSSLRSHLLSHRFISIPANLSALDDSRHRGARFFRFQLASNVQFIVQFKDKLYELLFVVEEFSFLSLPILGRRNNFDRSLFLDFSLIINHRK